jgi:hypothetical protein
MAFLEGGDGDDGEAAFYGGDGEFDSGAAAWGSPAQQQAQQQMYQQHQHQQQGQHQHQYQQQHQHQQHQHQGHHGHDEGFAWPQPAHPTAAAAGDVLRPPRDLPPDFDFDFALDAVGAEEVSLRRDANRQSRDADVPTAVMNAECQVRQRTHARARERTRRRTRCRVQCH